MSKVNNIVNKVIVEATSDQVIYDVTEASINAALGAVSFDTVMQDMPNIKQQYYSAIAQAVADKLGVPKDKVGHYVTSDMKVAFAKAFEDRCREIEQPQDDEAQQDDDTPKIIVED